MPAGQGSRHGTLAWRKVTKRGRGRCARGRSWNQAHHRIRVSESASSRQKKPLVHLPVWFPGNLEVQPADRVREDYGSIMIELGDKTTLPESDELIAQLVQVIFGEARKKIH